MTEGAGTVRSLKVSGGSAVTRERHLPEEVPVAFVYNGTTYAVMMASPTDLEAFALGFSLSEGIVASSEAIESLEVVRHETGIELRLWLADGAAKELVSRRRRTVGPTGCGLCGVESLEAAVPACPRAPAGSTFDAADIAAAFAALAPAQTLHRLTQAVHAAGYWTKAAGLLAVAEDVGRHNALDKLIGRLSVAGVSCAGGIVLLTSRVSIEMVQKAAHAGAAVMAAVSAPTHLAVATAEEAGITLVAVARADAFEIFTHPSRIRMPRECREHAEGAASHAA